MYVECGVPVLCYAVCMWFQSIDQFILSILFHFSARLFYARVSAVVVVVVAFIVVVGFAAIPLPPPPSPSSLSPLD